jgi:hypothetical protein
MTSSTDTAPVEVTAADAFDQVMQAKRAERVGDPPPEPVIETKTPETPADAGVSASEPQEIDLEALPPAVRARLEKAEADIKAKEAEVAKERSEKLAAIGRLGPTQRQLAELQRERAKPAPAKAEPAPVETDYYASRPKPRVSASATKPLPSALPRLSRSSPRSNKPPHRDSRRWINSWASRTRTTSTRCWMPRTRTGANWWNPRPMSRPTR